MNNQLRSVTVKQVPATLTVAEREHFLRELEASLVATRPRIVLDCSKMEKLDRSGVDLLLDCLERAIMLNGDVRLAAVPPEAQSTFGSSGAARLFQIFDTGEEAVESYYRPRVEACEPRLTSPQSKHAA